MIVDSSALVAILNGEDEMVEFAVLLERGSRPSVTAPTLVETGVVLGPSRHGDLDELVGARRDRCCGVHG